MAGETDRLTNVIHEENAAIEGENRQLSEEEEAARRNSAQLEELRRSAAEAERAPTKQRESFFGKVFRAVANSVGWLFGKYSGKTGSRNDRSGNEFQNMLIAKTQFQQGGQSAFAAVPGESLVMTAREGSENAVADFGMSSIHQSNTDEGEHMNGGTVDITYKNKLKLVSPTADFKHRYLSDTSAAYTSEVAELLFMGAFRPLSVKAGKFSIERNMSIGVDKFAEIASFEYDIGKNHVSMPEFVLSDGANGPKMQFASGKAVVSSTDGFVLSAGGLVAGQNGMEPIAASQNTIKFNGGLAGHEEEIPISGGVTFNESGMDGTGAGFSLGKIQSYKDVFGAADVSGNLMTEPDGALGCAVGASKWVVEFNDGVISLIKGGEKADLSVDTAKRLHVVSEAGASIDLNILPLGLKVPRELSADKTDFTIGDDSFTTTLEKSELALFGKQATGVKIAVSKAGGTSKLSLEALTLDLGENMKLANIKAEVGSDGLSITSGTLNIAQYESDSVEAKNVVGTVTQLSLNNSDFTFEDISGSAESITIGETFEADAMAVHLSKTKELGFGIAGDFTNLSASIEPEDKGLNVDVKDLSGSLVLNKKVKSLTLSDKGHIDLQYGDSMFISLKGLMMKYSEAGFEMTVGQGYGVYKKDEGSSPFGGVLNFSEFTAHIQNVSIAKKKMTVGEGGVFKVDFSDLELFDKSIGNLSLSKTPTGFENSLEIKDEVSKKIGDIELKLSGTVGFSYTSATGKFAPILDETKVEICTDKVDVSAEGFKLENKDTLVVEEVGVGIKSKSIFGNDGETPGASVKVAELKIGKSGVSFKELSATLEKTFSFWNDGLIIGNPKIGITNNFSGFSLGGLIKVNKEYFKTGAEGTVFFEKADGFKPKLSSIKDFFVEVPNLAKLKIEESSFDTENVIEFKNLSYESGFDAESFANKSGFFYQLCSLGKDIKVNLSKAKYENNEFHYEFADLNYFGSSFKQKFGPVEVSIAFEKDSATVGAEFELDLPKKPEDAAKLGKEDFTRLFTYGMSGPVCPFINVGADFFAGADLALKAKAEATFNYGEEKEFLGSLSASIDKAVAGIGVEGYASFGLPYIAEMQLGIRGVLAGNLNGTKLEGKLGLAKTATGIEIIKDPEKTSIDAALKGALTAKLQAFVRPAVILMDKKDLLTFDIANVNLFSCSLGGKGAYEGDVWRFNSEGFTWSSDFNKDAFNPDDPKSLLSRSQTQINDFKSLESAIAGTENAIGLQDWATEDALEKSVKLQSDIIPRLEEIRKSSANAYGLLKENDAKYSGEMLDADAHILKHKERLQNAALAEQAMAGVTQAAPQQPVTAGDKKAQKASEDAVRAENKRDAEAFVDKSGKLPPAAVWAYISQKFDMATLGIIGRGSFASRLSEMQEEYIALRRTIKEIGENAVASAARAKAAREAAKDKPEAERERLASEAAKPLNPKTVKEEYDTKQKGFSTFVGNKDEEFDKQAKLNAKPINKLQAINLDIISINKRIEVKNKETEVLHISLESLMKTYDGYDRLQEEDTTKIKATVAAKIEEYKKKVVDDSHAANKLRLEKLELLSKLDAARGEVNLAALDAEKTALGAETEQFKQQRTAVSEARGAYMGPSKVEALDLTVASYLPDGAALEDKGILTSDLTYDASALSKYLESVKVMGLGTGITAASLTHKQFQAYSELAVLQNGNNNIEKYRKFLDGLKLSEFRAQPSTADSEVLLKGLFSGHGIDVAGKDGKAVTMESMKEYTQGRIDAYESRKATITGNEKSLEENIVNCNLLYSRAVDAFTRMNSIRRTDFIAKSAFGGKDGTDSVSFSDSYRPQLNKLVVTEDEMSSGTLSDKAINTFTDKAASDVTKSESAANVFEEIKKLNAAG